MPAPQSILSKQEVVLAARVRSLVRVTCDMRGLDPAAVLRAALIEDTPVLDALIPLKEAARLISCSPKTLYNKSSSGIDGLPIVKIGSRSNFRVTDLVDYIARHRVHSTSEVKRARRG